MVHTPRFQGIEKSPLWYYIANIIFWKDFSLAFVLKNRTKCVMLKSSYSDSRVIGILIEGESLTLCCGLFSLTSCRRPGENEPPLLAPPTPLTVLDRSGPHLFCVLLKSRTGDRQRVGGLTAGLCVPLTGSHENGLSTCGGFWLRLRNPDWTFISISKVGLLGDFRVDLRRALCSNVTYTLSC